jgi:predicted dehydrogenase
VGFGVIGADHNHIYLMTRHMVDAGGQLKGWWTREAPIQPSGNSQPLPASLRVLDYRGLLDDPDVELILIGAMPNERASLALEAMNSGKDVMTDKPGAVTLEELQRLRECTARTQRFWSVSFSERYWVRAILKAAQVVAEGRIGQVIHTTGLGPHRGLLDRRPAWFFEPHFSGGILNDLASHQVDHFMFFTESTNAQVVSAHVANFTCPNHPRFEDFGELLLQSERASGYARVDWLTPDAQPYFGDNRLVVLGTEGMIEVRKYVDIGGAPGEDHLFVVHGPKSERIDCSNVALQYPADVLRDVRERTSTAEPSGHSFRVTELTIRAQRMARRTGYLAR